MTSPDKTRYPALIGTKRSPNKLYFVGERKLQVIQTGIRNKCSRSTMNHHLFMKNIVDSPLCINRGIETSEHFFFECNNSDAIRTTLLNAKTLFGNIDLEMLLFTKSNLLYRDNESKFFRRVTDFWVDLCAIIFIYSDSLRITIAPYHFAIHA